MEKSLISSFADRINQIPSTLFADLALACAIATRASDERASQAVPPIGDYWPGQGGVYAGIVRNGERQWHLILAVEPQSILRGAWGSYGSDEPDAGSFVDGFSNTMTLIVSGNDHPIAQRLVEFNQIGQDGHHDFYIPSQKENNLLYINLPEHLGKSYHWSSTQYSATCAWGLHFEDGSQGIGIKGDERAARAVRRLTIY